MYMPVPLIAIVKVVLTLPPELLAKIVYVVLSWLATGIPEITPYSLISIPTGKEGSISQVSTAPPELEGSISAIGSSFLSEICA